MRQLWADPSKRRRLIRVAMAGAVALVLATLLVVARTDPTGQPTSLTADQRRMIDLLESVLLHDSEILQYDRIADQHDGRGYVAGRGDFTTAGGEVLAVVEAYTADVPGNDLGDVYLPALRSLARDRSSDVTSLPNFLDAWRRASGTDAFRRAQDDAMRRLYFEPALALARTLGLTTPLGVAIIYDSAIQHGFGPDPDGIGAMVDQTAATNGKTSKEDEHGWLSAFLVVRTRTLTAPTGAEHQASWPGSLGRVLALASLLDRGADDLTAPLHVDAYGRGHTLDPGTAATAPLADGLATVTGPTTPTPTTTPIATATPSPTPTVRATSAPPAAKTTPPKPPAPPVVPPVRFGFPTFASTAGLSLAGSATQSGQALRLTPADHQAGAAWSTTTIDPTKSFTTTFRLSIAGITDGMAFVIQSQGAKALGSMGGGLGYGTSPRAPTAPHITPSVDIEFDVWDNSSDGFDPAGHQHVAVLTNGAIQNHLFWADPGFSMAGQSFWAWLDYNAANTTLAVYVSQSASKPANALFTASINIAAVVGRTGVYAGLTAGTGDISATQDVLSWQFTGT
jgi:chitosanase